MSMYHLEDNKSSALEHQEFFVSQEDIPPIIKTHKTRWIILLFYVIFSAISSFQWIQYSTVANVVMEYYNISANAFNWTQTVFTVMWPFLVFPACFIVDRKGLRVAALAGCFATAIGAVIKVFSINPNLFYVLMIGQTIVAVSQVFIWTVPSKIAATWFKPNEVSMVCSLGIFGTQLGHALGTLIPSTLMKNCNNLEAIGSSMYKLSINTVSVILPTAFVIFLFYPKKPNHAPSQAQLQERINNQKITTSVFTESLKKLIKNKAFVIHVIAYGACFGVSSSSAVVLSQFNISHRDAHNEASRMGLPMTLIGMVGSILIGLILDQTHKYKETVFAVCLLSTLSTVWLLFALEYQSKWMIYFTIGAFSFFVNAYWPAGIEFAMEITFPSSESTTTGILLAVSRIFELIFTLILSVINFKYGAVWAVAAQVVILLTATLLTYWTPNNLRRQEAFRKNVELEKVPQEDEIFNN